MQSCFHCIPIKYVFGKESMPFLQDHLGDIYKFFIQSSTSSMSEKNESFPEWEPFVVGCPADQKMIWNGLQKGGAAKIKENFCPYCVLCSSDINEVNTVHCAYCNSLT